MKKIILLLISAIMVITLNGCGKSGLELRQEADKLYESESQEDRRQAFELYLEAAKKGDSNAQYKVGTLHLYFKEYSKAAASFKAASNQGHSDAQALLGRLYQDGQGVEKDYEKAYELYKKSSDQGSAQGQTLLGHMYRYGIFVNKDYDRALDLYTKAANQGYVNAINQIGFMYISRGYGMQDHNEAEKWYLKSANKGDALAQYQLGWLYEYRKEYEKALKCYRLSAKQGNSKAVDRVEYMERNGLGI